MRTDIAKSRVIQRLEYGSLAIPRPDLQEKASHVFWLRRMLMEGDHSWKRMLDHWLVEANRPSIDLHFKLGRQDRQTQLTQLPLTVYAATIQIRIKN